MFEPVAGIPDQDRGIVYPVRILFIDQLRVSGPCGNFRMQFLSGGINGLG